LVPSMWVENCSSAEGLAFSYRVIEWKEDPRKLTKFGRLSSVTWKRGIYCASHKMSSVFRMQAICLIRGEMRKAM
jgi:hypothetical protein